MSARQDRIAKLKAISKERVLILDGSWGVMFQKRKLDEADYRGDRFAHHNGQLKGNNDILCVTRPDIIADLHDQYFAAAADMRIADRERQHAEQRRERRHHDGAQPKLAGVQRRSPTVGSGVDR